MVLYRLRNVPKMALSSEMRSENQTHVTLVFPALKSVELISALIHCACMDTTPCHWPNTVCPQATFKRYQTEHKLKQESLERSQSDLKKLRRKSQGKNASKYESKENEVCGFVRVYLHMLMLYFKSNSVYNRKHFKTKPYKVTTYKIKMNDWHFGQKPHHVVSCQYFIFWVSVKSQRPVAHWVQPFDIIDVIFFVQRKKEMNTGLGQHLMWMYVALYSTILRYFFKSRS